VYRTKCDRSQRRGGEPKSEYASPKGSRFPTPKPAKPGPLANGRFRLGQCFLHHPNRERSDSSINVVKGFPTCTSETSRPMGDGQKQWVTLNSRAR
jgi:hypothetical protein